MNTEEATLPLAQRARRGRVPALARSVDPLVARILTVAFTLSTAGLFAVAYVALWVILPPAPNEAGPWRWSPTPCTRTRTAPWTSACRAPAPTTPPALPPRWRPHGSTFLTTPMRAPGHVPPQLPTAEAAAWAQRAQCQVPSSWQAPGWEAPGWQSPNWQAPPLR
ncbi:MAG: PspC domain-containing protein [Gordonibacter pamelaeae]